MVEAYTQVCVRINLTTGSVEHEKLSKEFCKKYIGGYGFVSKILWDECPVGIDPFDPRNPFIMAIGPFPGTIVPTSSKYTLGAKAPLSGRIGFAISSGSCGAQMRRAGARTCSRRSAPGTRCFSTWAAGAGKGGARRMVAIY